jgi:hypothetical protein
MAITWLTASACQNDDNMNVPRVSYGPEVPIGNGIARSFIRLDDAGTPTDIGFTLSLEGLNNLPDEDSWNVLPLPAEKEQTPYDHISLDWNPHGHVPDGVYNVPHFDMHFYMISQEERAVIEPGTPEMERLPEARFLPVNYTSPPGEGIPQMGKHWTDSTAVEFHGQPFKITYIYGSYDGHVIFHEPMITHDWLSLKRDTLITMPQPEAVEHPGLYPQQYSVDFDPDTEIFTITFRNLTKKE